MNDEEVLCIAKVVCPLIQDPKQPDPSPDELICVCGYPKIGLPKTDHPCPECGSSELAMYQSSFSHYGWMLAGLGAGISFVHSVVAVPSLFGIGLRFPEFLYFHPWIFLFVPLGVVSLFCTSISMIKREPMRKSRRNVSMAMFSILCFPASRAVGFFIYVANGGFWAP